MKKITVLALALSLTACAVPQHIVWNKPGAVEADYNRDAAQCDYETSAATQGTDYSYSSIFGQELDRSLRKKDILKKCMVAKGWSASISTPTVTQADNPTSTLSPTLAQKEKWIMTMAEKSGCGGVISINFKDKDGIREVFNASCGNTVLEFTCEFIGPVTEAMGGIPFVAVTGKPYQNQPACWR